MVRKTKDETEQTRLQIIAAARRVFAERGVSRTTLAEIAKEAGVTRGAIYWHFKNKPDLFFAMKDQITLPLIDGVEDGTLTDKSGDPLQAISANMLEMLHLLESDEEVRTTFEVVALKCEYVDEFASLDNYVIKTCCAFIETITTAYEQAKEMKQLRTGLDPGLCALETYTFMKGLIHLWLSDSDGIIIRNKARALIEAHIAMRSH